ncbi:MAG: ribonuclease H family protein [Tissierellia bacterium]|nr:ribonuclease H family protein [Tissierellia bacterium]
MSKGGKFYAVKKGREKGIYLNWPDCQKQVIGYPGAVYKSFKTRREALLFIGEEIAEKCESKEIENQSLESRELEIQASIKKGEMVAYVDGSFNSRTKVFGYGVVIFDELGRKDYSGSSDDEDYIENRNVAGEVFGAVYSMKKALALKKQRLYLYYDYLGIEKWATGEWKRNKKLTIKYHDFYQGIKDELEVKFFKVEAHSGDLFNEEADKLAKKACGIE